MLSLLFLWSIQQTNKFVHPFLFFFVSERGNQCRNKLHSHIPFPPRTRPVSRHVTSCHITRHRQTCLVCLVWSVLSCLYTPSDIRLSAYVSIYQSAFNSTAAVAGIRIIITTTTTTVPGAATALSHLRNITRNLHQPIGHTYRKHTHSLSLIHTHTQAQYFFCAMWSRYVKKGTN